MCDHQQRTLKASRTGGSFGFATIGKEWGRAAGAKQGRKNQRSHLRTIESLYHIIGTTQTQHRAHVLELFRMPKNYTHVCPKSLRHQFCLHQAAISSGRALQMDHPFPVWTMCVRMSKPYTLRKMHMSTLMQGLLYFFSSPY